MKRNLKNIFRGIGSTLQIHNSERTLFSSREKILGEIKNFGGSLQNDSLKVHRDIELAWGKVVKSENKE
jgi:hypothetical protein